MTSERAESSNRPHRLTESLAPAEHPPNCFAWPSYYVNVQNVGKKLKLREKSKKQSFLIDGRHFPPSGSGTFESFLPSAHIKNIKTIDCDGFISWEI